MPCAAVYVDAVSMTNPAFGSPSTAAAGASGPMTATALAAWGSGRPLQPLPLGSLAGTTSASSQQQVPPTAMLSSAAVRSVTPVTPHSAVQQGSGEAQSQSLSVSRGMQGNTSPREPALTGSASVPSVASAVHRGASSSSPETAAFANAGSTSLAPGAVRPAIGASITTSAALAPTGLGPGCAVSRSARSPSPQPHRSGEPVQPCLTPVMPRPGEPIASSPAHVPAHGAAKSPGYATAFAQPPTIFTQPPLAMVSGSTVPASMTAPATGSHPAAPSRAVDRAVSPTGGGWWDECLGSPGPPPAPQRHTARTSFGSRPSSVGAAALSPGSAVHRGAVSPVASGPPSPRTVSAAAHGVSLSSGAPPESAATTAPPAHAFHLQPGASVIARHSAEAPANSPSSFGAVAHSAASQRWSSFEGPTTARLSARTGTPASSPASGRAVAVTPPVPVSSLSLEGQMAAKSARKGWGPPTPPRDTAPGDGRFPMLPEPPALASSAPTAPAVSSIAAATPATVRPAMAASPPLQLGLQAMQTSAAGASSVASTTALQGVVRGRSPTPAAAQAPPPSIAPKGPELLAFPPEPGSIPMDGEWSPRDSVWKRYFSESGLLAQEEPLLYSTTASTFVTPRPLAARQGLDSQSTGALSPTTPNQSMGTLPGGSLAAPALSSAGSISGPVAARSKECSPDSKVAELEANTRANNQLGAKTAPPALPRLQMPHRDTSNLDIALGAPVSLERAGDDFGLGLYSASSLAAPVSPSESLAGSSVASTIFRNHSGGSGWGGGMNVATPSADSARMSDPPGSVGALQSSIEELRSAKAASASANARWPSRRSNSRQNSTPGSQAPPPPPAAGAFTEDSGPEQEPSPTMRHLRDLAPAPSPTPLKEAQQEPPPVAPPLPPPQERAADIRRASKSDAPSSAPSNSVPQERRPRSRQASLGASSTAASAPTSQAAVPEKRRTTPPRSNRSPEVSARSGSTGPEPSPNIDEGPTATSGSLRGLVGRFGPPPAASAGSPPPVSGAGGSSATSTGTNAGFMSSPGAAVSSAAGATLGVGLDLEGLTPRASPSPGAASMGPPSGTPADAAASCGASAPPSRQWSRSEPEDPMGTHGSATGSSAGGSAVQSATTSPVPAVGAGTTASGSSVRDSSGPPRLATASRASRRASSVSANAEEEKWTALLAFKEQVAAVAASDVNSADWAAAEAVALEVAEAARAVEMKDFATLRSFRQPPAVVTQVVDAVAAVLGLPESGWTSLRRKLDQQLLQRVSSLDSNTAARLPRIRVERFQRLLQVPAFCGASTTAPNTTAALASLQEKCPSVAPLARWCTVLAQLLLRLHGDLLSGTGPEASAATQDDLPATAEQPRRLSRVSQNGSSSAAPSATVPASTASSGPSAGTTAEAPLPSSSTAGADASGGGWEPDPPMEKRRPPSAGGSSARSAAARRSSVKGATATSSPSPETTPEARPPDLGGLEVEPELWKLSEAALANVYDLRVGRRDVGSVTFHGVTDCRGLLSQLPELLVIEQGEVVVYPNHNMKPPVGEGLNKPASVVLFGCMPKSQQRLADPRARERYRQRVAQMTEEKGAVFEDYDCEDGTWKFRVNHF